ncbi:class I SAM-dependent methyltransferase [Patescibacteria group bacterium]|nr:class I SAM-dependent methyltransferase [Patescibacteria group bacterium]
MYQLINVDVDMRRAKKVKKWINERGPAWTVLHTLRWLIIKYMGIFTYLIEKLERLLIRIEKHKFLTGEGTICSLYHTIEENKKRWNRYDWSYGGGEEWTKDVKRLKGIDPHQWKANLINKMMKKYITEGSTVLEIGPGAGRWTEILLKRVKQLLVADISERCLKICKERFKDRSNIEYFLIKDGGLNFIRTNSTDYIWSYDVFVHMNPTDIERYLAEFHRILKPNGVAIIHHAGTYPDESEDYVRKEKFRSYIDKEFFAYLVKKHQMKTLEQNETLAHSPGDVITTFMNVR